MALVESWLYQRLTGSSSVMEIATSVFPVYAPEYDPKNPIWPFLTFTRASTERTYESGAQASSDGLPTTTMHLQSWGNDYFQLKQLQAVVRLAVDGVRDLPNGISSVMIQDEYDLPVEPTAGQEFPVYAVRFVLEISHSEPVLAS